ncbi:MAG: hypothetical protein ABL996_18245 [Micropepsaceae bacterium]
MLNRIVNGLIVAAMVSVLALFELGLIARGDAFFIATAIVVVFTGQQLIVREHMGFSEAAASIFTRPQSFRSRSTLTAYFACLALAVLVTAQVFAFA